MIFNSQVFMVFFLAVYALFWLSREKVQLRNLILLMASYIFYGWWDWRFLSLIALSTILDYFIGLQLGSATSKVNRKWLVVTSICFNLGLLGVFKYFNFFSTSFFELATTVGLPANEITLNVVLPVGISFYTFQTLSYSIDIYRGNLAPTRNFITFATFVAFFPQLVAGPIERASNLLPQLSHVTQITPEKIHAALFLILWGYFKKVFIADKIGEYVNIAFDTSSVNTEVPVLVAVITFSIQIYCDFSGYSDIARGIARLMGFELMVNFRLPYFALSPGDFWNRWHISLSTWLRDYLYIPLGGNRNGSLNTYRNLMLTMLLGGLWHGAAWNFVIWGGYHGLLLIVYRKLDSMNFASSLKRYPVFLKSCQWLLMITFTLYGWLLFRAESTQQIYSMTLQLFNPQIINGEPLMQVLIHSLPLILMQVAQARSKDLLILIKHKTWIQAFVAIILLLLIIVYGHHETTEFIYFQF